jgi:hypothetical protein
MRTSSTKLTFNASTGNLAVTSVDSGGNGTGIKWKTFSGTLSAQAAATITHELTSSNIYSMSGIINGIYDMASLYNVDAQDEFLLDSTTIKLKFTDRASNSYKVIVFYV